MKIVIAGAAGRMGQTIFSIAKTDKDIEIAGLFEYAESPSICPKNPLILPIEKLEEKLSKDTVLIDFTSPESAVKNLETAVKCKSPAVIGTTGFSREQKEKIKKYAGKIPMVLSPNMSVGVNVLFKLVEEAAKKMAGYDVEIVELHHNKKKDAPSGTAAKLAEIAANALTKNIDEVGIYGRHGLVGERKKEEIGVLSVRGGDIVGDHTVYFVGIGERIELTHRANSRDSFAVGAIRAAKWITDKPCGLYDMSDVLS